MLCVKVMEGTLATPRQKRRRMPISPKLAILRPMRPRDPILASGGLVNCYLGGIVGPHSGVMCQSERERRDINQAASTRSGRLYSPLRRHSKAYPMSAGYILQPS